MGVLVGDSSVYVTVLSVLVLARLLLPIISVTRFAAMEGIKVPAPVTDVAERVKFWSSPEFVILQVIPVAVPDWVISDVVKILSIMGSEKSTVNLIGKTLAGSF